jgi:8-amino-7-oxononanoate synthase
MPSPARYFRRMTDAITERDPAARGDSGSMEAALEEEIRAWAERGLERVLRVTGWRDGARVTTEAGPAIDFSSNDYLGLASSPLVRTAAHEALDSQGVGAGASRLIAGDNPEHEALEIELAQFFGVDGALLFSSGYAANIGAIPALVGPRDAIFADAFNHASLIDACRLARASVYVYQHGDTDELRRMLQQHRGAARRALIVSDGLFSMDGDVADVPALVALAREFDAWTYVDDAHAAGCLGDNGRGTAEFAGLGGMVDVTMATLGKAFGAAGAVVYGSARLKRHLLNRARSFVFSTALPPAVAAAARAAVGIVTSDRALRARLRENVQNVRSTMRTRGITTGGVDDSHIVPIMIGDAREAVRLGLELRAAGLLVGAVRPPTVAHGSARLRISVSAAHTSAQIEQLADALHAALRSG